MGRFMEVALLLVSLGIVDGVSYLLATHAVEVAAGETGGYVLIEFPQLGYNITRTVTPYSYTQASMDSSMRVTMGVENKAFVIHVFGEDMSVFGFYVYGVFSSLPISALGSRYVVSTCLESQTQVVLVIANHNHKTDVDITLMLEGNVTYDYMTYNDGDTIHVTLDEYQTFTMKSKYDLTGTVINATNTVAVLSGEMEKGFLAMTQLLPVRHHRTEYVMYTGDYYYYRNSRYKLQVISDQSGTEIMLNNGSTFSLGVDRVYRQYLAYNESLYFNATRPVMATLCRNNRKLYLQRFAVVVPVTYFVNNAFIPNTYCINILTKRHVTDIEVFTGDMAPATLDWVDIPGSEYKAGRNCSHGRYFVRSASRFAAYGFYGDMCNGGYRFPTDPLNTGADAGSATPTTQTPASNAAGAMTLPTPVSTNTRTDGQEYPEGSRYVVSTCLGYKDQVVLVIANHNHKTDVDITLMLKGYVTYDNMTYNDGDTIHVTLDEYQTFTMKSKYDLTGTVINTTNTVAVFSGTMQGRSVIASTQLLPVRHHETKYVMYTGDHSSRRNSTYQLQVLSDQSNTEIMLNNGSTFSLGDNRVYRQYLAYNESLYFNATRPVMATLCTYNRNAYYTGFAVVVPVTYFVNSAFIPNTWCINILTKQHVTDIEVFTGDMALATLDWVDIPGSEYKAGKNCSHGRYIVRSASRFAAYGFYGEIFNGGYRFPTDPATTGADAGSATPTTQTPASTAAGATTLPTPVSNNTRTGGQEYAEGSATPTTQTPASTTAGATTLPTPVSTNTRTDGQEYAEGINIYIASLNCEICLKPL
ncbi:uncharacterized protein [Haliotis cracherodii]|uniref:uncharacterized protein isoform X2 n=1 Tax=Haliotis cracherodii TaxID=6455 RepID=UPI0039EC4271